MQSSGKLFIVATPIGNLEDITLRALRILREVDVIAAEDTRHTLRLLNHYEIRKPLLSYHQFNEARRCEEIQKLFAEGKSVALVSDAGFPGISDPGERLISTCVGEDLEVEVVPGPSAVLHALAASGLPMSPFTFEGFLPVKGGQRARCIARLVDREETTVFFESPHRIQKTLDELARQIPERHICVARELTKKFEEVLRGPARDLAVRTATRAWKGEISLVIAGAAHRSRKHLDTASDSDSNTPDSEPDTAPHPLERELPT